MVLVAAVLLLMGELAWSSSGKFKKYVEDLTWTEFLGLWGIECQSYNMWSILGCIMLVDYLRNEGIMAPGIPLTEYISFEWAVALFMAICVAMLVKHGIVMIQADRKVNRPGKNSPM